MLSDREKKNQQNREYYARNRERILAQQNVYYRENKKRIVAQKAEYQRRDEVKYRAKLRRAGLGHLFEQASV